MDGGPAEAQAQAGVLQFIPHELIADRADLWGYLETARTSAPAAYRQDRETWQWSLQSDHNVWTYEIGISDGVAVVEVGETDGERWMMVLGIAGRNFVPRLKRIWAELVSLASQLGIARVDGIVWDERLALAYQRALGSQKGGVALYTEVRGQ